MTTSPDSLEGVLPIDKPAGPTSHDVVAAARRVLRTRRIGHTGTLDPFASGLLLLCVGRATRLAEYLTAQPKTYDAVLRLGEATDTDDPTGQVIARSDQWRELSRQQFEHALARRRGRQLQTPPAFSAKKVAGERLYERARRGEAVSPTPVAVEVFDLHLTRWDPPLAGFEVTCSSGTYIRAIARDVGEDLETFSHLVELRRTAIGEVSVGEAVTLERLLDGRWSGELIAPLAALQHLPRVELDERAAAEIRFGRALPAAKGLAAGVVVLVHDGALLAMAEVADGRILPKKVLDPARATEVAKDGVDG